MKPNPLTINQLTTNNQALTMSSREIATLCDKEHKNVKRDIEVMAEQLELDTLKFEHIYKDSQNREQTEYLLDKETCLCLVAGYNAKLRLAIIKRWQELEQSATITDPLLLIAHMATQAYEAKQLALKQETVTVGDVSFPKPYQGEMEYDQIYYYPTVDFKSLYDSTRWADGANDRMLMSRGLVHLIKENAIAHAKALIRLSGGCVE